MPMSHSQPPPSDQGHSLPERGLWREFSALLDERDSGDEFLHSPEPAIGSPTRRSFLQWMSATVAAASTAGCGSRPREGLIAPERATMAGQLATPLFFATAMTLGGYAQGLLVEQHFGRPIKVEGNPDHPASRGATSAFAQASVLSLYDPDRSSDVLHNDGIATWEQAWSALADRAAKLRAGDPNRLRILSGVNASPTLARQIALLEEEMPGAAWYQYEPVSREWVDAGARLAFGQIVEPLYDFQQADVVLSLDADFLGEGPRHLRDARGFADRRRVWRDAPAEATMSRLYAVSPVPTLTSAVADHRLAVRASDVEFFAVQLAAQFDLVPSSEASHGPDPDEWLQRLADDLRSHRGRCLVIAGATQPPRVHAVAHALNQALDNVGRTVRYIAAPSSDARRGLAALTELAAEMRRGTVDTLVLFDCNPVYDAPIDLDFEQALSKVPLRVHLGLYRDETARHCDWHLPAEHFLESWHDAVAYDGTATICQPVMNSATRRTTPLQLVQLLRGVTNPQTDYQLVQEFWRDRWNGSSDDFSSRWERALHDGVVAGSEASPVEVRLREDWWESSDDIESSSPPAKSELEIVFRPDPTVYDGRFANHEWLQELPKPLTSVTWDNVAVLSPATAARLGLRPTPGELGGDLVTELLRLRYRDRVIEVPAWIMPGHAEACVTVFLGYGRSAAGRIGNGLGYNAYHVRTSDQPWFARGLEVERTGRSYKLAVTQLHHRMAGRDLVRHGTLQQFQQAPHSLVHKHATQESRKQLPILPPVSGPSNATPPSLYPETSYPSHRWGMVIDLSTCIGCQACVVACQAENNIPTVGKDEVMRGREMHWLRVDMYHQGSDESPDATYFQPVPCMHCEKAPCEIVCPVNATVHSDEGLNDMVYARCVGTRYCSNNCPYKVRRFNYYQYAEWESEPLRALRNPDVTVRSRGVMEKCTYCVQRINAARIHAQKDSRPLIRNRAGQRIKPIYPHELLTACQAVCPTEAIVFGDLNDPQAPVVRMQHDQPLHYGLLDEELGTQPRTTYLAALRNPVS